MVKGWWCRIGRWGGWAWAEFGSSLEGCCYYCKAGWMVIWHGESGMRDAKRDSIKSRINDGLSWA